MTFRQKRSLIIMLTTLFLCLISLSVCAAAINSPFDAYQRAHPEIAALPHEEAIVFFTDVQGEILKEARVTQQRKGGIYYVPWELIFGPLLPENTVMIYLVHNHPSGNPNLSEPDIELGSFWAQEAASRGITLDLLAITNFNGYSSLHESQLMLSPEQLNERKTGYLSYVVRPGLKILGSGFVKVFADNTTTAKE